MTDPTHGQQPQHGGPAYGSTPAAPPASGTAYGATTGDATKKTLGLLALIFGIVGIVLGFLIPIIGLLLGIAAVVLGVMSRKREPAARGMALGGIVTGAVAIVVSIVSWILAALVIAQTING